MSACGRKQTVKLLLFQVSERPLLVKADVQQLSLENSLLSVRYTPQSRHSAKLGLKVCL